MSKRYENRYGRGGDWHDRDRADDRSHDRHDQRGYMDRTGDEVRSWFGDDDAERRRRMDEQRDHQREGRSDWNRSGQHRADWNRSDGDRMDRPRHNQGRSDWNSTSWSRSEGRGDWNRADEPRGPSRDESRYRDPAANYSRTDSTRGADWDPYRYRQNSGESERDRSRDHDADRDRPMNRVGGSSWAVDDGRTDFGAPPTGDFGYGQRNMAQHVAGQDTRWGRGPKGYQRADSRIHEDVCDRLTYSDVDAENIEVTVSNGEVTLSGTVRDRWDKRRAEDVVEEIAGVRDVHNNIRVQRGDHGGHGDRGDRSDRGIGMSEHTDTQQPGSVLGVNPAAAATTPTSATDTKKS